MPILKNPKHEKFAQELAKQASQSDAYVAAGYKRNDSHACRLAGNGKVRARVEEILGAAAEKTGITIEKVLNELALIGFSNMQDYIAVHGDDPVVALGNMTRNQAAAVSQITVEDFKDGRGEDARDVRKITFKLSDKRAALVDIGKHLGMFKEKLELTGANGGALEAIININGKRSGSK